MLNIKAILIYFVIPIIYRIKQLNFWWPKIYYHIKSQNKIANSVFWLYILFFYSGALYNIPPAQRMVAHSVFCPNRAQQLAFWSTTPTNLSKINISLPAFSLLSKENHHRVLSTLTQEKTTLNPLLSSLINHKNRTLCSSSSVSPSDLDLQVLFYLNFQSFP